MKNTLLILLFTLFTTLIVAQEKDGIKIGINAGATLSNVRGDADDYNSSVDFLAGVSLEVPLSTNLAFITNINYERKTFSQDVYLEFDPNFDPLIDNTEKYKFKSTLQYISVPLNLKYYIGGKKNFYLNAGPYVAFFVDDVYKLDGENLKEWGTSSQLKEVDFGVNLGVGTRIGVNEYSNINIELRHNYGLSNIDDTPYEKYTIKTNAFNLIVNWAFEL